MKQLSEKLRDCKAYLAASDEQQERIRAALEAAVNAAEESPDDSGAIRDAVLAATGGILSRIEEAGRAAEGGR